jgi:EAL domain-containing protein (putative c-di-GMP-specific phosphodiesterase class I)
MSDDRIDPLTIWFQPIVDLNSGKVAGFEALSRIVAADGSAASPAALMTELEREPEAQYALIRKVLESIRREIVPAFAKHPDFYVSVNIPPSVFGIGRSRIAPMLAELDLDPWRTRLVAELTERQALTDLGRAAIANARSLGVAVAMDDFGTGHSGLSQIVGLDLDILKIDRSLLTSILDNRAAARMLRGIVGLAAALRLRTVAEGVESWEHAFFLRAAGVDYGQGYYWSKAVPGTEIQPLLEHGFAHRLDRPSPGADGR